MKDLPKTLLNVIDKKSIELGDFCVDGASINIEEARERLISWCENFDLLIDDLSLLVPVIENLNFFSDKSILEECNHFYKKHEKKANKYYYTPIGENTESSFRILSRLNADIHYSSSISDTLKKIREDGSNECDIVFIDDFLNSGGQVKRIFENWFESNNVLGDDERKILKQCRLKFIFYQGMEAGANVLKKLGEKYHLDLNVTIINSYGDEHGFWGDQRDLELIRSSADAYLGNHSIYQGWEAKKVTKFYKICLEAGKQLNRFSKPDWDHSKSEQRALGYGNSSQLFITEYNVPTCTLTCLWRSGLVSLNNKKLDWKGFLPRRNKLLGGSETLHYDETVNAICGIFQLDKAQNKDVPFEVMVCTPIDMSDIPDFSFWSTETSFYESFFMDEFYQSVFTLKSGIKRFHYDKSSLSNLFNNERIRIGKTHYRIKARSLDVFKFPDGKFFISLRIRFTNRNLSMEKVSEILYHLRIISKNPVTERLERVLRKAGINNLRFLENKYKLLSFIRCDGCLFSFEKSRVQELLNPLSRGARLNDCHRVFEDCPRIDYESNATIGISEIASILLCDSEIKVNDSWLQTDYFEGYTILYLMVFWLKSAHLKSGLDQLNQEGEQLKNILDSLGKSDFCQNKMPNQFFRLVYETNFL